MFTDPDKPLPPAKDKKDGLGSVLNAIIEIGDARYNNEGGYESLEEKVAAETVRAEAKIKQFNDDTDADLKKHTDLRGAVHGETKTTVGLPNKDNWPMASLAEHEAATVKNKFAHPLGLKRLVEARLTVNPINYIRSRILPLANGGPLGGVPQWPYRWSEGDISDSPLDPKEYYTQTPWTFATENGVRVYPSLSCSDTLTQQFPYPGNPKTGITPWGGAQIRVYNRSLDLRRTRPSLIRGYGDAEPEGRLAVASSHLFDRTAVFYVQGNTVRVRSFNRVRIPFDTITTIPPNFANWKGIIEARENLGYNIVTDVVNADLGWGKDIHFTMELRVFVLNSLGMETQSGPGRVAETIADISKYLDTLNITVPNAKIRVWKRAGKPDALAVKLSDIVKYTAAQTDELFSLIDVKRARQIAFAWRNRLLGEFSIRVPVGWKSKDGGSYLNYYIDLNLVCKDVIATNTVNINVTTLRDITADIQVLDGNLLPNKAGRFVQYPASAAENPFHPKVFDGTFDSNGGHIKVYTYYNRQYVGYYQHNVDSPLEWINNGDAIAPALEKYIYSEMSTVNNDGFYGDHLRHIPVNMADGVTDYITLTRDWRQGYRWCYSQVETDTEAAPTTPQGRNIGPTRVDNSWFDPPSTGIPSFVISNEEDTDAISSVPMVFNSQNKFKGYGSYTLSPDFNDPISFDEPVDVDDSILNWVAIQGGGWTNSHKQLFLFKDNLFWFSQTLDAAEVKADGTDCYYGVFKNIIIETLGERKVVRVNGTVDDNVTKAPLKVNTKATLSVNRKTIAGNDAFDSTDVYIMKLSAQAGVTRRLCMVNLGPFNNFYFEFLITSQAGTYTIAPFKDPMDPIFPYDDANGFSVDLDTVNAYGTKAPHRFHVNFQTPVMLNKMMWAFRKTPGHFGLFTESRGTLIATDGIMTNFKGACVYPVGSILTVGGSNVVIKKPLIAQSETYLNDELLVTLDGNIPTLYSVKNNPNGFPVEPNSRVTPSGFMKDGYFSYYDPDGYKNALMPVIDNLRMNFYGYGSSFPALLGIPGSGLPINRFYQGQKPTILKWNTAVGRIVPIAAGSNVYITVNGVAQNYDGSGLFTIPGSFTGVVTVNIEGMSLLRSGVGLTEIVQFGSVITSMDFSGSNSFTCNVSPPKSIRNYNGLFSGALGATYPGINNWDVSQVSSMVGMFENAKNFNQDISRWSTGNVTTMVSMFKGATAFNTSIATWNTAAVETFESMFEGATAYNKDMNTWVTTKCRTFVKMFKDATAFNGNISNWDVKGGTDFTSMFENALAFNININAWQPIAATSTKAMFKNTTAFNSQLNSWKMAVVRDVSEMFALTKGFNRTIAAWPVGSIINMDGMFKGSTAFGADGSTPITNWVLTSLRSAIGMFQGSAFNSDLTGLDFKASCDLTSMFESALNFNKNISTWNVTNVTNLTRMFAENASFKTTIDGWTLASCTDFTSMFENSGFNAELTNWVLSTTEAIRMSKMFKGNKGFNSAGISGWNTEMLTYADQMFMNTNIIDIDFSTWNTANCTDMSSMFELATNFLGNGVSLWNVSKVTTFSGMFATAFAFNVPLIDWRPTAAVDFSRMFMGARTFNQNLSSWFTSNVTTMANMFNGATVFNGDVSTWKTSKVTTMAGMFKDCAAYNRAMIDWDLTNVLDTSDMLNGCTVYAKPLNSWRLPNVLTIAGMFANTQSVVGSLTAWGLGKCTDMSRVFSNSTFNGMIGGWNTSSCTTMREMFKDAVLFNQDISGWSTSKVTDMSSMFENAAAFNQPIGNWKVFGALNMRRMFKGAVLFNQDISPWDTSYTTDMSEMFHTATAFNQPLSGWNVPNVTTMNGMFCNAVNFNNSINNWNVAKVTDMAAMFQNARSYQRPMHFWNTGKVMKMDDMFWDAIVFNQDLSMWNVTQGPSHGTVNGNGGFDKGAVAWVLPRPNFPS